MKMKCDLLTNLIQGYDSLDQFYKGTVKMMKKIEVVEEHIKERIESNPGNIYYLKMASLIRSRILNDPITAMKYEHEIKEIKRKDSAMDKNTISSISLLSGKVGSIVASFRTEQGKIIRFSERCVTG